MGAESANIAAALIGRQDGKSVEAGNIEPAAGMRFGLSVGYVRQQRHEPGPFDGLGDGVLAGRSATAFAAADDLSLPAGELAEQLQVLIVNVHRSRASAVDEDWIFLLGAAGHFGPFFGRRTRTLKLCHKLPASRKR